MRFLALTAVLVGLSFLAAPAAAQCSGGTCSAPAAVVVIARTPVRNVVYRVRSRRARRAERRVGRRMARRARWGVRGRCCG